MMELSRFDPNSRKARWSAMLFGVIGVQVFIVQPGFVQGLVQMLGFSERAAGFIASVEMLGVAVTATAMSFLASRSNWRKVLFWASLLAASANVASAFVQDPVAFAVARGVAGLALGAMISLSWAGVGLTRDPDLGFSLYLTWVLVYGAVGLLAMPVIFSAFGMQGFLFIVAGLSMIGLAIARNMPEFAESRGEPNADALELRFGYKCSALAGVLAYNIAQGIAWAYLFLIGTHAGLGEQPVANALTISQVVAILGALTALVLGKKWGRGTPLVVGVLGGAASLLPLLGGVSLATFAVAVVAFNYLWNMVLPYILASVASYDRRGMMVVYAVAAQMIGLGVGPAIGAYAVDDTGFDRTIELSLVFFSLSLLLLMLPLVTHVRLHAANAARVAPGAAGMSVAAAPSSDGSSV